MVFLIGRTIIEPRHEKTCLRGLRLGETHVGYSK